MNTSTDSATSLGNFFQCLTTAQGQTFFLVCNVSLPGAIEGHFCSDMAGEAGPLLPAASAQVAVESSEHPLRASSSQAEQAQFPAPLLTAHIL